MKKHLKRNWTVYTIGAFGGLISSIKPDYWWVYIIVFGIVVGAIDIYFAKDKKKDDGDESEEEKENRFRKKLKPGLNEDEIDEMRDFMKRADHHLEKIKEKRFKNLKKKKKFTMADIIETARGMEISDVAIKLYLRKRGFKEADINEAMKILKK